MSLDNYPAVGRRPASTLDMHSLVKGAVAAVARMLKGGLGNHARDDADHRPPRPCQTAAKAGESTSTATWQEDLEGGNRRLKEMSERAVARRALRNVMRHQREVRGGDVGPTRPSLQPPEDGSAT
jgi:hypothetical protein